MTLSRKTNFIVYSALFVFCVFALFKPPIDPDFGWHYKYGEYVFTHRTVLRDNIFSYTFPDYKWANSYWFSELIMYLLYRFLGAPAMSLTLSAFGAAVLLLTFSRIKMGITGKALGIIMTASFWSSYIVSVRPMFFSSVFMLILVYILVFRPRCVKFLPVLFLLWANTHADFAFGLFVFGVYTIFELLKLVATSGFNLKLLIRTAFYPLLSVAVTVANPYGIGLWQTLLKETHPYQFGHIAEWQPVGIKNLTYFMSYVGVLGFLSVGVWESSKIKKRLNPLIKPTVGNWYFPVFAVFFILAVKSGYFMRLLVTLSAPAAVVFWDKIASECYRFAGDKLRVKFKVAALSLLLFSMLLASAAFFDTFGVSKNIVLWSKRAGLPYGGVQYLKKTKSAGLLYNNYAWGGFIIWQLPEYKTFIDGRMPSWRVGHTSVFEEYVNMRNDPDEYFANTKPVFSIIFDKPDSSIVKYFRNKEGWNERYRDEHSVILVFG